jgi:hypothetical protein
MFRRGLEDGLQHSEAEKAQFKQLYATRRRNQLMVSISLVAVIIAVVLTEDRGGGTILGLSRQVVGPIFLAIVAAALFYSFRNWRCPACNKYLGRAFNPRHCQNCGVELGA